MTGNDISVCAIKESIAALNIQRQHEIDKDNRCIEYRFLCRPLAKQLHVFIQANWMTQCHSFQSPRNLTLTPELSTSVSEFCPEEFGGQMFLPSENKSLTGVKNYLYG